MSEIQIKCECGAIYQRAENVTSYEDKGHFDCQVCGKEIASWHSSRWPSFALLEKPEKKRDVAHEP